MIEFGFGRRDISIFEPGMAMAGWGVPTYQARGVAVPRFARAVVMRDLTTETCVAFIAIETLVVTQGLWRGVIDASGLSIPPTAPTTMHFRTASFTYGAVCETGCRPRGKRPQ